MGSSIAQRVQRRAAGLFGTVRDAKGHPLKARASTCGRWHPMALRRARPGQSSDSYRGVFETGADGTFEIHATRPVDYEIPTDGPVGKMLRSTGRHAWRPAHTHFMVSCPGYKTLITHAFDCRFPSSWSRRGVGVRESLIIDMNGGRATFNVVLDSLLPGVAP